MALVVHLTTTRYIHHNVVSSCSLFTQSIRARTTEQVLYLAAVLTRGLEQSGLVEQAATRGRVARPTATHAATAAARRGAVNLLYTAQQTHKSEQSMR